MIKDLKFVTEYVLIWIVWIETLNPDPDNSSK